MIVDTSVLVAIAFREPGSEALIDRLAAADSLAAGTPTLAEAALVLTARLGSAADGMLERLLDEFGVQEIPFGEIHWREAVETYRRYGKGRHPAALNFGDCMTYAVARLAGEPLFFVGDDTRPRLSIMPDARRV
jgi:ribonuclease VapC